MENTLLKIYQKIDNSHFLCILRNALSLVSPFMIIGAFALILRDFPNAEYQNWLENVCGGVFFTCISSIYRFTLGSFSLILAVTMGIAYRDQVDHNRYGVYLLISLVSYFIFVYDGNALLSEQFICIYSIFAILVSYAVCSLLNYFIVRMTKRLVPFSMLGDTHFSLSIHTIKPIAIVFFFVFAIRACLYAVFGFHSVPWLLNYVVSKIFVGYKATFGNSLLYVLLAQVMYLFGFAGVEGFNDFSSAIESYCIDTNAYQIWMGGKATELFSSTFFNSFVFIGGMGSVLCLVVALFFASHEPGNHRAGKVLAVPTLFNIGEPVFFGLPVLFNPIMFIPFIVVPIVLFFISVGCMKIGIVPIVTTSVNPMTPIVFSGYFATGSIWGSVLQIFNLGVGTLIYIPFIRFLSKPRAKLIEEKVPEIVELVKEGESVGKIPQLLKGDKAINIAAKGLLSDLYDAIRAREIALYYQPQLNNDGEVIGCEGLFRWKHPLCGYIYPPLAVQLVYEDGFANQMTYLIIQMSCASLERLNKYGCENFKMSVNILPQQLEDGEFARNVKDIIKKYDFGSCTLALEITEQGALASMPFVEDLVKDLQENGVELIMDDFGMGHSSMSAMQNNRFSYVKLDGALVRDILNNQRSADIVQVVCGLANKLDFHIIAEYVETEEQKERLMELGCEIYQGYLYSKALPFDDLVEFLQEKGTIL